MVPVQWAVLVGVVMSALVYFFTAADDVQVLEGVFAEAGGVQLKEPPDRLPSRAATVRLMTW